MESVATVETAPEPAPQVLTAYAADGLAPALQAYADAQGVALNWTDDASTASLLALDHQPDGTTLDVTSDTLLAAAAARANITGSAASLPAGRSLYGYWVSGSLLNNLLGDGAAEALQNASWTVERLCGDPAGLADRAESRHCHLKRRRPHPLPEAGPSPDRHRRIYPAAGRTSGYTVAVLAADGQYTADA